MSTVPTVKAGPTFQDSLTCQSLRSAYLGETQTRQLYLRCARRMEEASMYVIAHAFRFTAAQEKEHGDIFRGLLEAYGGAALPTPEDLPDLPSQEPLDMLRAVVQTEHDLWDALYPHYAHIAMEEGYPRIAEAFSRIAETEQCHAQRFLQYAKALAEGRLFRDEERTSWFCLPCGQLYSGCEAPELCCACGRDRGHFIRTSHYPFVLED